MKSDADKAKQLKALLNDVDKDWKPSKKKKASKTARPQ
jgi:hypothetical protein